MENKKRLVNRRKFIAGAGAGLLGIIGGSYFLNEDSEANRLLKEFPDEILGAGEVRKYRTEGARNCLVHILQGHYVNEERYKSELKDMGFDSEDQIRSLYKEDMEKVKTCQEEIYDILSYLIRNKGLSEVYVEGHTPEDEEAVNNIAKNIRLGIDRGNRKALLDKYAFRAGAPFRLLFEGKIQIKGAEILESSEFKLRFNSFKSPEINEEREDVLLSLIDNSRKNFSVTVYGAGHNFGDNIIKWNSKNPERKFSLIEVVPKSYR